MGQDEFAQVHCLDELMEMTTHNLVGRRSYEHLHLLDNKGLLHPCLRDPNIIPDTRRSRINFILQLIPSTLPFILDRNNFFNWGSWGGCPCCLDARSSWHSQSDRGPLIHHPHISSPKIGKRLILLGPHLSVHSLIKFCRRPYMRKTLVQKKKKNEDKRSSMDELNTYSFFPQSQIFIEQK